MHVADFLGIGDCSVINNLPGVFPGCTDGGLESGKYSLSEASCIDIDLFPQGVYKE